LKKIILLAIILSFITACYDYQELNDRAIVSGISIDYEEEEYIVNFEILNNQKSDDPFLKAYMVEGKGETIVEAFEEASDAISKETYLAHLKVLILSENAAKEPLRNIADFMLRDPYIRNIFSPVVAKDCLAKELLASTSKESPVVSEKIDSMIRNNKYNENVSIKIDFDQFMDQYEDERIDPSITAIKLVDEKPVLAGMAILKDGSLQKIVEPKQTAVFNVLNNKSKYHRLNLPCEDGKDGFTIINLYDNKKTNLDITEETLKVSSKLNASVIKDSCGYDFRDSKIYDELSQKYEEVLKKEYEELWNLIKKEKADILGLRKKYYQKTRNELPNWQELSFESTIEININRNGKTYEVKKDE
jgi:spore germination protein KC